MGNLLINNLSKTYWSKGVGKTALSDVTLNVPHGEIFALWVHLVAVKVHC